LINAVDEILSEASFYTKSEDSPFLGVLPVGSESRPFWRRIEIVFLYVVKGAVGKDFEVQI
jgi:hypothetical protein